MRYVVQFPHPGREPSLTPPTKAWRRRDDTRHTRAFLEAKGHAFASSDADPRNRVEGLLRFWGEWEADAEVRCTPTSAPRFIQTPLVRPRTSYKALHNTDPFVFDGPFLYSNCRQRGVLLDLTPGSILIFGSTVDGQFLLDTLFVVRLALKCYKPANAVAELRSHVPSTFIHAVARPLESDACGGEAGCASNDRLVLYQGATPEQPIDGMFSFAPATKAPRTFLRPAVTVEGLNPLCSRSIKILHRGPDPVVRRFWDQITAQVLELELLLGTYFKI